MFPRSYFAGRFFAPVYFPQSQGGAPAAPALRAVTLRAADASAVTLTAADRSAVSLTASAKD